MRCEFLKEHRGEFGSIRKACGILHVPESEYYDCVKRRKSNAQIEREALEGFVAERFNLHKDRYGYRRINRELRRDGIVVSEKMALVVMRKLENGKGHETREEMKQDAFKHIEFHCNRRRMSTSVVHNAPYDLERDDV